MASVLIVDDSKVMVASLQMICQELGHQCIGTAGDGAEAYDKYSELHPDFVTMDINMPKVDGLAASRNILRKYPDAKIIIISSVDNPELRHHAVGASGVVDYIVKPAEKEKLQEVIDRIL